MFLGEGLHVNSGLEFEHLKSARLRSNLCGLYAVFALALSGAGVFSLVLAIGRIREIGVRIALGATSGRVVQLIASEFGFVCIAALGIWGGLQYAGWKYLVSIVGEAPVDLSIAAEAATPCNNGTSCCTRRTKYRQLCRLTA